MPENFLLRFQESLFFPPILGSLEEAHHYRGKFITSLDSLRIHVLDNLKKDRRSIREIDINSLLLTSLENLFNLSYQDYNDVDLYAQHGEIIHELMRITYPNLADRKPESPTLTDSTRIRIGYLSNSMKSLSLGQLYEGWIRLHIQMNLRFTVIT